MLQGIFNLIKGLVEFVSTVVGFVFKLIEDLVYVVGLLTETGPKLVSYLSFLPAQVLSIFAACLTVIVIYKIVGRD